MLDNCRTRRPLLFTLAVLTALAGASFAWAGTDTLPLGFRLEQVLSTPGVKPSGIEIAPDGRIFYGERTSGQVRIVAGGMLQTTPFVTIAVASAGAGEGLIDLALHPDFPGQPYVYVSYTESATRAFKIVRYTEQDGVGSSPLTILSMTASPGGTRIGGSLAFGADRKLYVTTGDFETASNAQNNSSLAGKILRLNDDGSVPADNPIAGNKIYAKGFRNGGGLGVNRSVGTLYQTDQGVSGVKEECNAFTEGNGSTLKNYAWDVGSGKLNNASYVDPLVEYATIVTPAAVIPYTENRWPASHQNDVYYACSTNGKIEEVSVSGPRLDTFASTVTFFNPTTDGDGTKDATCPKKWADAAYSEDGAFYMTSADTDGTAAPGLYRILYDETRGPRDNSPVGSPMPLTMKRTDATHVRMYWEDQKKDAFVGTPLAAGQHNSLYTIWRGLLPVDSNGNGTPDWNHVSLAATNGTAASAATLSYDLIIGGANSEYYLVSSQNANKEGPLGYGSDGTQIPGVGTQDWCDVIGYGKVIGQCAHNEFKNTAGTVIQLPDENGVKHSMSEYRNGNVIHFDLSAADCGPCQIQALLYDSKEEEIYRARGVKTLVVMEKNLAGANPYVDQAACTAGINAWRSAYGGTYTILCDVDTDGNGRGDVFDQFDHCNCFPSNTYIDRNWVIYNTIAGTADASAYSAKAWPQWCE